MSLRSIAEQDLTSILEDSDTGFGWDITVTSPNGASAPLVGYSNDISQAIDPDTGMIVSSRVASVTLSISSLATAGLAVPSAEADEDNAPWVVSFDDINGAPYTFKVRSSDPDRAIGAVVCMLEAYSA